MTLGSSMHQESIETQGPGTQTQAQKQNQGNQEKSYGAASRNE